MKLHLFVILLMSSLFFSCASSSTKKQLSKKADILYSHGTENLVRQNYTEALGHLLEAKKIRPDNHEILNNLGMAYYFLGKKKLAIKHIKEALELKPSNSDARNNLASIYFEAGNLEEAKKQYYKNLENLIYLKHFRTHYNLGLIAEKEGKISLSRKHFKKSYGMKSNYCVAPYRLGMSYRKEGRLDQSLKWFRKSSKGECSKKPEGKFMVAKTLRDLNFKEKSLLILMEIQNKFPDSKFFALATNEITLIRKELSHPKKISTRNYEYPQNVNNKDQETVTSPSF